MKSFLLELLFWMLVIAAIVVLLQIRHHKKNIERCLASEHKTKDYEINSETHRLYCRSSDNGMQELKTVKPRSVHLDEHKREQ